MYRLAWADVETTGIDPKRGAEIWELALIVRDLNQVSGEPASDCDLEYCWHIRPDLAHADPMALKVGGYYQRCQVQDRQPGEAAPLRLPGSGEGGKIPLLATWEVAHEVATLLNGAHFIAANPAFDSGHLDAFLRANGQCLTVDYHLTDIGSLVRGWAAGKGLLATASQFPLKLDAAARATGINPDAYERHSALDDARVARDVYDAVMGGAS